MKRYKLKFAEYAGEAPLADAGDLVRGNDWILCASRLRHYVDLPKTAKHVTLVFTKRGNANSFELRRGTFRTSPAEPGEILTDEFMNLCDEAWDAGCRHVHLEYE